MHFQNSEDVDQLVRNCSDPATNIVCYTLAYIFDDKILAMSKFKASSDYISNVAQMDQFFFDGGDNIVEKGQNAASIFSFFHIVFFFLKASFQGLLPQSFFIRLLSKGCYRMTMQKELYKMKFYTHHKKT